MQADVDGSDLICIDVSFAMIFSVKVMRAMTMALNKCNAICDLRYVSRSLSLNNLRTMKVTP